MMMMKRAEQRVSSRQQKRQKQWHRQRQWQRQRQSGRTIKAEIEVDQKEVGI